MLLRLQINGTHFSGGAPAMFDQFLASRGLLVGPVQVRVDSVAIHTHGLFKEKGLAPLRFGRPAQRDTFHADGYSDHLPISLAIEARPRGR